MNTLKNNTGFEFQGFDVTIKNDIVFLGSHLINDCLDHCAPCGTLSRTHSAQIQFAINDAPKFTKKLKMFLESDKLNDLNFALSGDQIKIVFFRNLSDQPMIYISSRKALKEFSDLSKNLINEICCNFIFPINYESIQFLIDNLSRLSKFTKSNQADANSPQK